LGRHTQPFQPKVGVKIVQQTKLPKMGAIWSRWPLDCRHWFCF